MIMHLMSISQRLENPQISIIEKLQREVHIDLIKKIKLNSNSQMLSFSCGDGMWDYLSTINNKNIKSIIATDIVDNPVQQDDIKLLSHHIKWQFKKIKPDSELLFKDETFNLIIHHDVIEHTYKPYQVLAEQYRVLKKGGYLIFSTPNLLRPVNIVKLLLGKLDFPLKISENVEIGDYIHVQEFNERQLTVMLEEIGYKILTVKNIYWGVHLAGLKFSDYPESNFGKKLCHYLMYLVQK